jgi:hypothetical protein
MDDMHDQMGAHDAEQERWLREHATKMETLMLASEVLMHRWHQFEDARRALAQAELRFHEALQADWPIEDLWPAAPWFHDGYLIENAAGPAEGNRRRFSIKKCTVLYPVDGDAGPLS